MIFREQVLNYLTSKNNSQKYLIFVLMSLSYFLSLRVGLFFSMSNQVSVMWPATGLGIGLLYLFGYRFWPAIFIGSLASNLLTNTKLIAILGVTSANTTQALLGSWIIYELTKTKNEKSIHRSTIALLAGIFIGALISSIIGVTTLCLAKVIPWNLFRINWINWVTGDYLGGIITAPMLLAIANEEIKFKWKSVLTLMSFLFLAAGLVWFFFTKTEGAPFLFLLFPFLLLSISSLGPRSSKVMIFLFSLGMITAAKLGLGFYKYEDVSSNLVNLQLILFGVSLASLLITDFKRAGSLRSSSVVLFWGWLGASVVFYSFFTADLEKKMTLLQVKINDGIDSIHGQMFYNTSALRSGASLFAASKTISRGQWHDFVSSIELRKNKSGVNGMGVVFKVPKSKLENFIKETRLDNYENFVVKSLAKNESIELNHSESYVITYLEPLLPNKAALGLDLATEINRLEAADLASQTGKVTITKSITLVQDGIKNQGILIFYPLYSQGETPQNLKERMARNIGWIYTPIKTQDLFSASLEDNEHFNDINYLITEPETKNILAQSKDYFSFENKYENIQTFKLANRLYQINTKPTSQFFQNTTTNSTWAALAAILMSLFLASFVSFIEFAEKNAQVLVDERTRQLEETAKIAKLGGWEYEFDTRRFVFSKYTREILAIDSNNTPTLSKIFRFFKPGIERDKLFLSFENSLKKHLDWDQEIELVANNGLDVWVKVLGKIEINNNKIIKIYGTIQDITDRVNLEKQLTKERAKSLQASKLASLGELSAGMAHEINNPLAIISGSMNLLEKVANDPEKLSNRIEVIQKSIGRISKIVNGLKKFSRSSDKPDYKEHNLADIIRESVLLTNSKSVRFDTSIEAIFHIEPKIFCDEIEIEQVLVNLINNGIDAVRDHALKWVKLEVSEDSKAIVLRISDSGPGIPESIRSKLFDPFFTTKAVGEGTGLGLSITKGILDEHKAVIAILPNTKNTCFEIRFQKIGISNAA
jgi:C4-dicarboxylate-specific signal transduction histidine kinase/integral membrane sensor domain MASE1